MNRFFIAVAGIAFFIQSCSTDADENAGTVITVNFRLGEQSILETKIADAVIIEFSNEADFNGALDISLTEFNAQYDVNFTTQPGSSNDEISVEINNGSSQSTIVLVPLPDSDQVPDSLLLTITGTSSDLIQIGEQNSTTIFLTEDNSGNNGGGTNTGSGSCNGTSYDTGTVQCTPGTSSEELDIITWNIENFPMQSNTVAKVVEVIRDLNVDIIAVQEIDEISSFNSVVNSLSGYEGVAIDVRGGIELGYIYKTSEITSFGTPVELFSGQSSPFPREPVEVDITHQNGMAIKLINLHLKCCGGSENISRRTDASIRLKDYVDTNFPNDAVIILGDWNEDFLDNGDSFQNFIDDSENYIFADLPINEGSSSNFSFPSWPSHLDHILLTDELCDNLVSSYTVRLDDCDPNYFTQVSDHRPVMVTLKANE